MARRIVFPGRDQVGLEAVDPGPLGEGTVRVRTAYSLMSTGTEGIVLHGLFDEGTHWADWVSYPFHPGYSAAGVVEETGPGVTGFAAGDRVAARAGHASEHVVPATACTRIPDGLPLDQACWFGLAKIAMMGARAAGYQLGDTVAVIGAGPIGQMSLRWAAAAGATGIVAVDPLTARHELARRGGATHLVPAPADQALGEVTAGCGGERPRVVIDTTGNAAVFAAALGLVADHGRLVLLGDTGSPASQHLTSDVIVRGVTVIGAHDRHSSRGGGGDRRLHEQFFQLVRTGRFPLDGLNTHTFRPQDCAAAYDLAARRRADTVGIVFDWTEPSRV